MLRGCFGRSGTPPGGNTQDVGVPGFEPGVRASSCESAPSLDEISSLGDSLGDSGNGVEPGCPRRALSGCFGRSENPSGQRGTTLDVGVPGCELGEASSGELLPSLGESLGTEIGNGGAPGCPRRALSGCFGRSGTPSGQSGTPLDGGVSGLEPVGVEGRGVPPAGVEPRGVPPGGVGTRGVPPDGIGTRGVPPDGVQPRGVKGGDGRETRLIDMGGAGTLLKRAPLS